jgi:tetratricopeptide (TPR) repeat protein
MHMAPGIVLALALIGCGPKAPPEAAPVAVPEASGSGETGGDVSTSPESTEPTPTTPLAERVAQANLLLADGSPESAAKALKQLRSLLDEAPDSAVIRYNIGLATEGIGDNAAARKSYLRATDLEPGLGRAWLNIGAMAERDGDNARALQNYRAGLRNAEDDPQLFAATIGVLRKLGRNDEAIREAKSAIKTNGNNVDAYNNLGLVYLDQGKLELAQFIYQRALSAIPEADGNALVHANLGRVYLAQGKVPLAEKKFQDALLKDNDLVVAMMFLGQLYTENRNWEGTVAVLERARELEPDTAAIRVNLGIGYRGLGRLEESEASYKKALELESGLIDVHLNLALLYGDSQQQFGKAFMEMDAYVDLGGTRTDLVELWRADFEKTKSKLERDAARKLRRDEQRQKREEEKRLLAEEEARQAREAAAAPPAAPAPAPADPPAGSVRGELGPAVAPPDTSGSATRLGQSCVGVGSCGAPALECAQDNVCRDVGTPGTFGIGIGCVQASDCASGLSCDDNVCAPVGGAVPKNPAVGSDVTDPGTASPWGGQ